MSLANEKSTAHCVPVLKNNAKSGKPIDISASSNTDLKSRLNKELQSIWQEETDLNCTLSDRDDIAHCRISHCVVALGSNFKAEKHLAIAREALEKLTRTQYWSTPFLNPDYTATPTHLKPDYTNQCGYLHLEHPQTLRQFIEISKRIEADCQRIVFKGSDAVQINGDALEQGRVSIDIDVLAVTITGEWHIIKQRYPFKEHEVIGLKELLKG